MTTDTGRAGPNDPGEGRNSRGPYYAQDFATAPYRPPTSRPSGPGRRGRSRKLTVIVAAVVAAVLVAVAAVTVSGVRNAPTTGFVPTGKSAGQDAEQITSAFLAAWKSGDLRQAARYTDHPSAAGSALVAYRDHLHLNQLTGATVGATPTGGPGGPSGPAAPREHVTFAVNATVSDVSSASAGSATTGAKTLTGSWHYHSSLVAYQRRDSKAWYIAWAPDVLAPGLTATTHLAAVAVPPQTVSVTDSSGNNLASYGDAGLTTIASVLRKQGPPPGQGSPGLSVEIQTTAGTAVANSQAAVIAPGNGPSVATTISARAEAAARRAAAQHQDTSIVAIQPSTGKVLAIANNDGYNDFALTAAVAPGSTGKIISATALLANHVLTPDSDVSCPETYTVQGITYHNDHDETEPASTSLITEFAQSCNNAFDQWWPHLADGQLAANHAEQAKLRPFTLALPATCSVRQLATLDAAFRDDGSVLDVQVADPADRAEMVRSGQVQAALLTVPADGADWVVPLGLASPANGSTRPLHLESLRHSRRPHPAAHHHPARGRRAAHPGPAAAVRAPRGPAARPDLRGQLLGRRGVGGDARRGLSAVLRGAGS